MRLNSFFFSNDHVGGTDLGGTLAFMCAFDMLQVRATAQVFNDTKKYGPYGELFFSLMRRETPERKQFHPDA